MTLFVVALISGMLTVLAPCVLPILPVVLGATALRRHPYTPYIVILSLSLSVVLFTVLLKATTLFIVIPPTMWLWFSGAILALFGLSLLIPSLWTRMPYIGSLEQVLFRLVGKGTSEHSFLGPVLIGVALGPIFSTCSPTYFVILSAVLPVSFALGLFYISVYTFGLALMLMLIVYVGERYMRTFVRLADPQGMFKRTLGILFILLGVGIALGFMARFEVWLLGHLPFDVTLVEQALLERFIHE